MKFSVVIVNYASWPLTVQCIESVRATGFGNLEIIVVDNDREEPPVLPRGVRLIRNGENLGFARACNRGLAASGGDLVVFANPDSLVETGFFEKAERFFESAGEVAIAGPRILDACGELQLSARREVSPLSGLLGRTSLLTRLFPTSSLVKSQFPAVVSSGAPMRVDWVSGACMIARRRALREFGPFDERFFMYFEDADLCRRAREAGWSVAFVPGIEIVHRAGGSSRSRPRAVWLLHKSAFLYHRKHGTHGPLNLFSALVVVGLALRAFAKLLASLPAASRLVKRAARRRSG